MFIFFAWSKKYFGNVSVIFLFFFKIYFAVNYTTEMSPISSPFPQFGREELDPVTFPGVCGSDTVSLRLQH